MFVQPSLFGRGQPVPDAAFADLTRLDLGQGAWVDYAPTWLTADETLFEAMAAGAAWDSPMVRMYDRQVRTPRLVATIDPALHPVIGDMVELLSQRYRVRLDRVSAGYYRTGADSVAWHGDRIARELNAATVATVSLAGPRRFLLRPRQGGPARAFSLGHGDLIVMGGTCQRTWEHSVPKAAHAPPRIALMFRHSYDDGATGRV